MKIETEGCGHHRITPSFSLAAAGNIIDLVWPVGEHAWGFAQHNLSDTNEEHSQLRNSIQHRDNSNLLCKCNKHQFLTDWLFFYFLSKAIYTDYSYTLGSQTASSWRGGQKADSVTGALSHMKLIETVRYFSPQTARQSQVFSLVKLVSTYASSTILFTCTDCVLPRTLHRLITSLKIRKLE